jgi:segregation and condensation protein A
MTPTSVDYAVDLDVFQGPMDLLLYLIRKDEIDIYDIPIARITEQYLRYVEMLKLLNLENAGEYILMAATLIRIKAQMLLPRETSGDDEEDPREELTRALLEYGKFREAAEILEEKHDFEARLTAVAGLSNGYGEGQPVLLQSSTLFDLLTAFQSVMASFKEESDYVVDHEDMTVEDRIAVILELLKEREFATFQQLFADIRVKLVAILTFLAILEMVKSHRLVVHQSVLFSEIRVYRTANLLGDNGHGEEPGQEETPMLDATPTLEEVPADS